MADSTFKDIDLSFRMHPITGDIPVLWDDSAIKRSIVNLVRTRYYERGFNVRVGSNITGLLFENVDPMITLELKKEIRMVIENYEPRAELVDVIVRQHENTLTATVIYHILNNAEPEELTIDLERLR